MKLFELRRDVDETGISGTGVVAQGVIFDNGKCALTWLTEHTSTALYDSVDDVVAIHGHNGKTRVMQFADVDPAASSHHATIAALDECENIAVEFQTKNHKHVWRERELLARMFATTQIT